MWWGGRVIFFISPGGGGGGGGAGGAALAEALRARFGISVGRFARVAGGRLREGEARAGRGARRPGVDETGKKRANARCIRGGGARAPSKWRTGTDGRRLAHSRHLK